MGGSRPAIRAHMHVYSCGTLDLLVVELACCRNAVGNAAPPDDLNSWLPRHGGGADIVMVAVQEAHYRSTTAAESVIGTLHCAVLGATFGPWVKLQNTQNEGQNLFCSIQMASDQQVRCRRLHCDIATQSDVLSVCLFVCLFACLLVFPRVFSFLISFSFSFPKTNSRMYD